MPSTIERSVIGAFRILSSKDQELAHDDEWEDFLASAENKSQLTTLLADYLKSDE